MPKVKKERSGKELEVLIQLFLRAETNIINEIGRLRSLGNVDYHAVAALTRVQAILKQLETDAWTYVPKMVAEPFYANTPAARKPLEMVEKHLAGYTKASALTSMQYSVVDRLTANLMGEILEASATTAATLENALLGRRRNDRYRQAGLAAVAQMQAEGAGARKTAQEIFVTLTREGVTAFVDKAGRKWSLATYGAMAARTTSRQAEVLAVLTADEEQDLYQISAHGSACPICAPLEGRVYSRSGRDPDFPPLAAAFGKIDPDGPEDLTNSYLNIHPSCLHVLIAWTPMGRSEEEIQKIKDFSSFKKNPVDTDPRTKEQIAAYRKKEAARRRWLQDYRQWETYKMELGNRVPSFETFQKHKRAGGEKYRRWKSDYQKRFYLQKHLDYTIGNEESFIPEGATFETVRTIAGKGSKTIFRRAPEYAEKFGGKPEEWSKKVGKIESASYVFDVHWSEKDGVQYAVKVKHRKEKT